MCTLRDPRSRYPLPQANLTAIGEWLDEDGWEANYTTLNNYIKYDNFDIILDHFSRILQPTPPHTRRAMHLHAYTG